MKNTAVMRTGMGMTLNREPLPKKRMNASLTMGTGLPPVATRAMPRKMFIVARVTRNGSIRPLTMITPLTAPSATAMRRHSARAARTGIPAPSIMAKPTPTIAAVPPTDRSRPPRVMTKVIPKAVIAT